MRGIFTALFLLGFSLTPAIAQTANGKVTTTPPTYSNNAISPLSLDTAGNMRVNCVTGCSGGGGGGDVNINEIGGNPVTTTLPVSGSVSATVSGTVGVSSLPALPSGTNNIGDVDVLTLPELPAGSNTIGNVGLNAGSNTIGNVGIINPQTTHYSLIAAASTNSTLVKADAGAVYEISLANISTTVIAYLKLYDSATAPTCGTGTPVARYMIPFAASGGAGSNITIPLGKSFSSGIGFCITAGIADNNTTAVAASSVIVNLTYK